MIYFKFTELGYYLYSFFNRRFFIESIYNKYFVSFFLFLGGLTKKSIDNGLLEIVGPYGFQKELLFLSNKISKLSSGNIRNYALYFLVSTVLFLFIPYTYIYYFSLIIIIFFSIVILDK